MGDVKLLSRWDGWCDPCGLERPLLLTAKGEFGPRAWLSGVGMEDRTLVLTCAVCGEWQLCPWDEEFPQEAVALVEAGPEPAHSTETDVVTTRGIFRRRPVAAEEPAEERVALELPVSTPEPVAEDSAPVPARRRIEAEIPEITDSELLRGIALAEARVQRLAAASEPAAEPAVEEPAAARRRLGRRHRDAVEPTATVEPAEVAPARPQRRTAPVQHIVLQTAYGPARATAVPVLPAPRPAASQEQDDALHLLAGGLDLVSSAGR